MAGLAALTGLTLAAACSFQPAGPGAGVDAADDQDDAAMNGVDAPEDDDLDDDGVPNASDNCPRVENPQQRDHDGDGAGDECDPCPHRPLADGSGDADGDGVGDPCDPRPGMADRIAMFEGFYDGPGEGWTFVGTWDHDATGTGFLRYSFAVTAAAFAVHPRSFQPPYQLESGVVVDSLSASGTIPSRQAGVAFAATDALDQFYLCSVRDDVGATPARAYLGRFSAIDQVAENASTNLADDLAPTSTFRVRGSHAAGGQECVGTLMATSGSPNLAATQAPGARIALRTFGMGVRFDYLVVYTPAP